MKRAILILALATMAVCAIAAPATKTQDPAESWEPIGATWHVLPSSIGRVVLGGTASLIARVKNDGSGDAAEGAGEFYASMQEVFCRAPQGSMVLARSIGDKSEVLHFRMNGNTAAATLAKRMCAKSSRGLT